jgi:steroid delta-isomerase-like uncharacterized protein
MPTANVELVLRHHAEIWSKGDLGLVNELFTPTFVAHHPGSPDWVGHEGVKEVVASVRTAFPDFSETVDDVIAAGDKVVTRFRASGTHMGAFRGLAPTGKRFTMAEIGIFRIEDGKIAEKWGLVDRVGMLQQLGILPAVWPPMEHLYDVAMDVRVDDVGITPQGHRRIVQVTGGTFKGPRLSGKVLPGGGDWVLGVADGSRRLDVRVTLQTDDGALIYAKYLGVFSAQASVLERIQNGDEVEPSEYYFRVTPMFETASARHGWLNQVVAIGFGKRTKAQVLYSVYAVR